MKRHKKKYHPLFSLLFILKLLPSETIKEIPRTTKNDWKKRKIDDCFGFEYCAIYIKHFDNIAHACKYSLKRYTLSACVSIKKTLLAITNNLTYKKLLRTKRYDIVSHITALYQKGFSVPKACKLFGIPSSWYYYHKRIVNCPSNILRNCFKQNPNQLSYGEQQAIKKWIALDENKSKNLTQLFYEALNKSIVFCAKQTFNNYAKLLGYKKPFKKPKPKQKKGYRASAIFEALHIDTTYVHSVIDGVLKLTMVKDNFSKANLHFKISKLGMNSKFIKEVLVETFDKYKLFDRPHDIQIISDNGSENKGEVLTWIGKLKAPPCVLKIFAHTEIFQHSNNMIESSFNLFKNDFLKRTPIIDADDLTKKVESFIQHSLHRYFGEHYGITPNQILNGAMPDKDLFKLQIQQAKTNRLEYNKNFAGCTMSFCK